MQGDIQLEHFKIFSFISLQYQIHHFIHSHCKKFRKKSKEKSQEEESHTQFSYLQTMTVYVLMHFLLIIFAVDSFTLIISK